jgi:CRISP-associated protein Cas1
MQLYLDSFGAYLFTKNGQFLIKTKSGDERAFAVRDVSAILMTRGTAASTDAFLLGLEHEIPMLFIDEFTHFPVGQMWSGRFGSISTVRKNQAFWSRSRAGMAWVARVLAQKVANQRVFLQKIGEMPETSAEWTRDLRASERILFSLEKDFWNWESKSAATELPFDLEKTAETFRGKEGTVSRIYFQYLSQKMPADWHFEGRSKRPARDAFNALLNYLYGMLYCQCQLAVLKAGLDPTMAVLHVDQWGGAPTFVFDFIEKYRVWAEEMALELIFSQKITPADFETEFEENGFRLARGGGKTVVIDAFLAFLDEKSSWTDAGNSAKMVRRSVQIELDAQAIKNELVGQK